MNSFFKKKKKVHMSNLVGWDFECLKVGHMREDVRVTIKIIYYIVLKIISFKKKGNVFFTYE